MQQWEYQLVNVVAKGGLMLDTFEVDYERMQQVLNDLGRQGWEVVSSMAASTETGRVRSILVLLKRPLAPSVDTIPLRPRIS